MDKVKSRHKKSIALVSIILSSLIHLADSQLIANQSSIVEYPNYFVDQPFIPSMFNNIISGDRHIYSYTFNASLLNQWPAWQLQFYAEAQLPEYPTTENNYPLLVTTFCHGSIRSWEISVHFLNDTKDLTKVNRYLDNIVGKVLWHCCPEEMMYESWNLAVEISVSNQMMVSYNLKIVALEDFLVKPNTMISGIATPSSPSIFKFVPPQDWQYVFIEVASNSSICTLLVVQDSDIQTKSFFGSNSQATHRNIHSKNWLDNQGNGDQFPNGIFITFTPFLNDENCQQHVSSDPNNPFRRKDIKLVVRQGISVPDYLLPIIIPLLGIMIIGCCSFFSLRWSNKLRYELLSGTSDAPQIERKHSLFKSNIHINDLIIEEPNRVVAQSERYFRWVFISTAFYCIPVFQLIITFSERLEETGNFDLCFFNHYCSHMTVFTSWVFHDFNHMYSNIGHLLFGPMFALLVTYRQWTEISVYTAPHDDERGGCGLWSCGAKGPANLENGALTHYSLLYCLAFTQTMTGVMSAAYHVCPNQNNFQFDTVFMYTIAALTVVKIYQLRHPTYLSANFTFASLALVACITVIGLLWENFLVRVCFTAIHAAFLIFTLPKVCFNGYIKRDGRLVHHWTEMMPIIFKKLKNDFMHGRLYQLQRKDWIDPHDPEIIIINGPGRMVLPGFLLIINALSLLAIWTVFAGQNFATQILFICVINGSLYIIYYCALKWYHGECRRLIWSQPGFYLFISLTLWGFAIYFFFQEVATREATPAESRLQNKDCILLHFYDSHDMWHFLSSAGLFFSAMLLLTIDDDVVDQPKSTIPVF